MKPQLKKYALDKAKKAYKQTDYHSFDCCLQRAINAYLFALEKHGYYLKLSTDGSSNG